MKTAKMKLLGFVVTAFVLATSCGDGSSTSSKKGWSQEQREDYMKDCITSAKASYEQRGQQPDKEIITKICTCTGQKIEAKYTYEEVSNPTAEMRAFGLESVKNCATEK